MLLIPPEILSNKAAFETDLLNLKHAMLKDLDELKDYKVWEIRILDIVPQRESAQAPFDKFDISYEIPEFFPILNHASIDTLIENSDMLNKNLWWNKNDWISSVKTIRVAMNT